MAQLFMYTRERTCGDQHLARLCLQEFGVPYTEINISREPDAAQELAELIGCLAVPTLLIADEQRCPVYGAMVQSLDEAVGRLLDRWRFWRGGGLRGTI